MGKIGCMLIGSSGRALTPAESVTRSDERRPTAAHQRGRCVRRSAPPELLVEGRYPPTGPSVASWQGLRLLRRNGEYRGGRRRRDRLGEVNQLLDAIAVPPAPGAPSTRREPNGALAGDGDRTVTVGCQGGGTGYGASADLDRRCVQRQPGAWRLGRAAALRRGREGALRR